ncbi:MATE family efflux transporter [Sporanaerobium hydrogeniformans]|uniref:MATE family efflux transporter n=2 Tax=Sporanaerobium hydrogeniformans TaxID=3072179 RepID=A0AC61DBJ7_9FIRM|nr:MATE family efflux transporter [Sporanaerobium hydrogeniformans]
MAQDMTKGNPWRLILLFAIPLVIGNIFQQLYSMVDTIIVGRFVSVEALAAVGSTGAINFLVIGFVMGISSGFAVITAQKFGAGDEEGVRRSVATSIILCILTTVLTTTLSIVTVKPLLKLMNTPDNIMQDATVYISIIYMGIGATMYYNMIASILRALGDSKTPLYFLLLSSGLNIVLDLLFIINFKMGVAGAAYATVISQLIAAILCTFYTAKRYKILALKKEDFRWNGHFAVFHLKVGLPMALQFSVTAIGVMVIQGALNKFGSNVIAAFTAANKVEMLVTQVFPALGITMATYCGQNLGANQLERIKKGVNIAVVMTLVAAVAAALVNIFLGEYIVRLFIEHAGVEIMTNAKQYLYTVAIFYPILGVIFVYRNALQGMGEAFFPMLGGLAELVARFVVAITLPAMIGYAGICLASPMAWIAANIPLIPRYIYIMRRKKI